MTAAADLIAAVKKAYGITTDAELADRVSVSKQLVSQWKNGANPISDERATQLARLANLDPAVWLLRIRVDQSKGGARETWQRIAKRMGAAAALVVMVGAASMPSPASAKQLVFKAESAGLYIMSTM